MIQPTTRFIIIGADNMLDLLKKMLQFAQPMAHCIYFGKNEGDYSSYEDQDLVSKTKYIAVFDFSPMYVVDLENVQIYENNDTSITLEGDMDTTMSA